MKKTFNANIGGIVFQIDEDAYMKLESYLKRIRSYFSKTEGGEDIIQDIEARIAEVLKEHLKNRTIVTIADIDKVIQDMGVPEDFGAEEEGPEPAQEKTEYRQQSSRRFYRNPDHKVLGGVCSGIGAYFGIDPVWIRLAFIAIVLFGGTGILLYIILWIISPEAKTASEKLEMRGERVNISNIEKTIKDEAGNIKQTVSDFAKSTEEAVRSGAQRIKEEVGSKNINKSARGVFYDLGSFFKRFGKIVLKIFAVIAVIIGFSFLVSLFLGLIGIGAFTFPFVSDFIFERAVHSTWAIVGFILLIGIPILVLIIRSLMYLLNIKFKRSAYPNRIITATFSTLWLVAIVIMFFMIIRVASDFQRKGVYTTSIEIPGVDSLILDMNERDYEAYEEGWRSTAPIFFIDDDYIHISDDTIFLGNIELSIQESSAENFELVTHYSARGKSRSKARNRAEKINYQYSLTDSLLVLESDFNIVGQLWRHQKVRMVLKVPENKKAILNEKVKSITRDNNN